MDILNLVIGVVITIALVIVTFKILKKLIHIAFVVAVIAAAFMYFVGFDTAHDILTLDRKLEHPKHILLVNEQQVLAGIVKTNTSVDLLYSQELQRLTKTLEEEDFESLFNKTHNAFLVSPAVFDPEFKLRLRNLEFTPQMAYRYMDKGIDSFAHDVILSKGLPPDKNTIEFIKRELSDEGIIEESFPSYVFGVMIQTYEQNSSLLLSTLYNGTQPVPDSLGYTLIYYFPVIAVGDAWWVYSKN